jgi:UDP-N-acetylglucosamine--N-acetylmuramyl-(pentapeptide) pyrophosphoryl-undecaprenol N-acetylglucosamine transferase
MSDPKLVLLSAGGTGGHMTPAQALARDLLARGFRVELITDDRGLRYQSMFQGIPTHVVRSGTSAPGILGKIKGAAKLGFGILQAQKLIRRLNPAVVVGFGGYPSFPGVYAAQKSKIPTIIHEQNAIIGKANVMLAPSADRIAVSLPEITGLDETDRVRVVVTGNPVRAEIANLYNEAYPALEDDGELRILVMGGSLGATVFSDIVPVALSQLPASYRQRLSIVQQCRVDDLERVAQVYEEHGIKAHLSPFFDDVPEELSKSHLVIARSGASTVAEVATAGRPAIFVPYPHHKDQQQKMNADSVADSGGAWVMTEDGFTTEALLARIETFMQTPQSLFKAAEKARACGKPDAARKLGNLVMAIASGWDE